MQTILLLGLSESGKTTVRKHLQLMSSTGTLCKDKREFKRRVSLFVIENMQKLLKDPSLIIFSKASRSQYNILRLNKWTNSLNEAIAKDLAQLWDDKSVYTLFRATSVYVSCNRIPESFAYYLKNIIRISKHDYAPNDMDILMCYDTTHLAISTMEIFVSKNHYRFLELRGVSQLGAYNRDAHDLIVFVVDLAAFDVGRNSKNTTSLNHENTRACGRFDPKSSDGNRMLNSLKCFEKICGDKDKSKIPIILFFNKIDEFKWKINDKILEHLIFGYIRMEIEIETMFIVPDDIRYMCMDFHGSLYHIGSIKDCFEDYHGNTRNVDDCYDFIVSKFTQKIAKTQKTKVLCGRATDPSVIEMLVLMIQCII